MMILITDSYIIFSSQLNEVLLLIKETLLDYIYRILKIILKMLHEILTLIRVPTFFFIFCKANLSKIIFNKRVIVFMPVSK